MKTPLTRETMKTITKITYIIMGSILTLIILWNRLLRERLPRDIPFNLTIITFFCLLFTCITLIIALVTLFTKTKFKQNFVSNIINKSLLLFNTFATHDLNIKNITSTMQLKIIHIFSRNTIYIRRFYMCAKIMQILVSLSLLIEVIFFNHIKYFYSLSVLLLISLLYKYLIFLLESVYREELTYLELCIEIHYIPKNAENYRDHWDYARNYKIVSAEQWIMDMSMMRLKLIILSPEYKRIMKVKNSYIDTILPSEPNKRKLRRFNHKAVMLNAQGSAATVVDIYCILYNLNIYKNNFEVSFALASTIIYLICWSYILIESFHTLPAGAFDIFIPEHENPFI